MSGTSTSTIDANEIKRSARGRWPEILSTLGGIPRERLDGKHHPCPKCGGTDRFSAFKDFADTGGILCRKCFDNNNGDGLAALQWATGESFPEAVNRLADYLGIQPSTNGNSNGKHQGNGSAKATRKDKRPAPAAGLALDQVCFRDAAPDEIFRERSAKQWAEAKPGMTAEHILRAKPKTGTWPRRAPADRQQEVIAFAAFRPGDWTNPTAILLYRPDGQPFPATDKLGERKSHTLRGSVDSLIVVGSAEEFTEARSAWLYEGLPDAIAGAPYLPPGHIACTNTHGAGCFDDALVPAFAGKVVYVVMDADEAGRAGAKIRAEKLFPVAESVRVVRLPVQEMVDPHKPVEWQPTDVRDFVAAGRWMEVLDAADKAEPITEPPAPAEKEDPPEPVEAADDPHRLARLYLAEHGTQDGLQSLWWHRSEWHTYNGAAYEPIPGQEIRAQLSATVKADFDATAREDRKPPRKVTTGLLGNITAALESGCLLRGRIEPPAWLIDDPPWPARETLATQSCLLHLPTLRTVPPTPGYFSSNALPYRYHESAARLQWLEYLKTLWRDDIESIELLQEWFGYCLLPQTDQHKLLMILGPPRSGKGTIGRVMASLIGRQNVASPTLANLAGPFGLWPLVGKLVALVADARLSGRTDAISVVEKLLSISGEDPQDVHRKNMPTLAGVHLPVRFVLLTNELPNMRDASGALTTRVLLLRLTESYVGREDRSIGNRLQAELPGILNWAIEGWQRLQARGYFVQPESGQELLDDLADLASPISAYIRDRTDLGPEYAVRIDRLFDDWRGWCEEHGRDHPGTLQTFGRDLRAARPELRVAQRRDSMSSRARYYEGIGLKVDHQ